MADRIVVINSHNDLTSELRNELTSYYESNDHRPINNDSYSRYPMWSDFDDSYNDTVDNIKQYLLNNNLITDKDYCVIIHWEW
jgi:hypothetical protein